MAAATKSIVVFGGTGQQGSAFIRGLGAYNASAPQYTIYLLSRDLTAGSTKRLESVPGVKVVQAAKNYMDEPGPAFEATGLKKGEVHGAFSVQGYISAEAQLHQGGWEGETQLRRQASLSPTRRRTTASSTLSTPASTCRTTLSRGLSEWRWLRGADAQGRGQAQDREPH